MFNDTKNGTGSSAPAPGSNGMTGLERDKYERSHPSSDPVPPSPQAALSQPRPVTTTNGRGMAVQARPQPLQQPLQQPQQPGENAAHLLAGPGIVLKGEISGCDTLRVEGMVDGTVVARHLILCARGTFLGTAEADEADIEGTFDGTLNVNGRLLLRSHGRITGTVNYGHIEVERGGEISGQITPHGGQGARARSEAPRSAPIERRTQAAVRPQPAPRPVPRPEEIPAQPMAQPRPVRPEPSAPYEAIIEEPQAKPRRVPFFGRG